MAKLTNSELISLIESGKIAFNLISHTNKHLKEVSKNFVINLKTYHILDNDQLTPDVIYQLRNDENTTKYDSQRYVNIQLNSIIDMLYETLNNTNPQNFSIQKFMKSNTFNFYAIFDKNSYDTSTKTIDIVYIAPATLKLEAHIAHITKLQFEDLRQQDVNNNIYAQNNIQTSPYLDITPKFEQLATIHTVANNTYKFLNLSSYYQLYSLDNNSLIGISDLSWYNLLIFIFNSLEYMSASQHTPNNLFEYKIANDYLIFNNHFNAKLQQKYQEIMLTLSNVHAESYEYRNTYFDTGEPSPFKGDLTLLKVPLFQINNGIYSQNGGSIQYEGHIQLKNLNNHNQKLLASMTQKESICNFISYYLISYRYSKLYNHDLKRLFVNYNSHHNNNAMKDIQEKLQRILSNKLLSAIRKYIVYNEYNMNVSKNAPIKSEYVECENNTQSDKTQKHQDLEKMKSYHSQSHTINNLIASLSRQTKPRMYWIDEQLYFVYYSSDNDLILAKVQKDKK